MYVPDGSMTGISRKLPDKERTRLKSILKKVMPENAGVIVRTAAEGASEEELARDVARLSAQWENIQTQGQERQPARAAVGRAGPDHPGRPRRLQRGLHLAGRPGRGRLGDGRRVRPATSRRTWATGCRKWDGEQGDVFESYRIDEQIAKAMERKVWLPSGGSLVIDRTEAMTVVDVNTGKFTGQGGNLEETVTRNNLEAAEEIVRQLRLRDIGGIIVIDFIDMVLESNRDLVLRRMLECLARDRTKHQVAEVTSLGLVQMTRKRVGQGLLEAFSDAVRVLQRARPDRLHRAGRAQARAARHPGQDGGGEGGLGEGRQGRGQATVRTGWRDTVTDALEDVPAEDDQAGQTSGRGRRRSRRGQSPAE